jgi:molybdopterin-guanine dinucleotide biosynthesis protein A
VRVVDRVIDALRAVTPDVIAIANDAALGDAIGVPWRSDRTPGLGPLAGLDAALAWCVELGFDGIVACACDMPFMNAGLLSRIVRDADAANAVLPESTGPRGVEPLVAYYSVACLPAIAASAARGDHRLISFHDAVRVVRVPLDEVRTFGDPETLFMNLNTPSDRARADALVRAT